MTSELGEIFQLRKKIDKKRKEKNLAKADPIGWKMHTKYHWSRMVNGKRLDYWPSRNKFMYNHKVMCGDVMGFIKKIDRFTEQTTEG